MKKKVVKVAFVATIVMVCGICFMNSQQSETLSAIALANVEALADKTPSGEFSCWWDSEECNICDKSGNWLGCPCGCHEW